MSKKFHAFISHNSKDKVSVSAIANKLRSEAYLNLWFDKPDMRAGKDFEKQITDALRNSSVCVVFISENGWGPNHRKEVDIAKELGLDIIPVFLPGSSIISFFRELELSDKIIYVNLQHGVTNEEYRLLWGAILGKGRGFEPLLQIEADARQWRSQQKNIFITLPYLLKAPHANKLVQKHKKEIKNEEDVKLLQDFIKACNRIRLFVGISAIGIFAITTLLLFAALIASGLFFSERSAKREQTDIALSRKLADESLVLNNQADLALLLSVQAYKIDPTFESRRSVFTTLKANSYLSTFLYGNTGEIKNLAFSPDGQFLFSIGNDGKVLVYDVKTHSIGTELIRSNGISPATAFNPISQTIAYANNEGIYLFDTKGNKKAFTLLSQGILTINCLTFSPDGNTLISGGGELGMFNQSGQLIFWDALDLSQLSSLIELSQPAKSIAISPDGSILALGLEYGEPALKLYDVSTYLPLNSPTSNIEVSSAITSLAFSSDGRYLAIGSEAPGPASPGGAIEVMDMELMEYIGGVKTSSTPRVNAVAFTELGYGGEMLFSNGGRGGNSIFLWNPTGDSDAALQLTGHNSEVTQITMSPDGKTLASGDVSGKVILWNLSDKYFPALGTPLTFEDNLFGDTPSNNFHVSYPQFSLDGNHVIGYEKDSIVAWSLDTGRKVEDVNFSPSLNQEHDVVSSINKIKATASDIGITYIDTETNATIGILPVRAGYLAISPDEDYIISYGSLSHSWMGEYPYLWNISMDTWITQACKIANRNLTLEEWALYLSEIPYQETCP